MRKTLVLSGIVAVFLMFIGACETKRPNKQTDNFDKKSLLTNIGTNLIVPGYDSLVLETDSLVARASVFIASADANALTQLRAQVLKSWERFELVSAFEMGPADADILRASVNTFPCDTAQIMSKIKAGDYDLSAAADIDAKGFPALDFLLFEIGNDTKNTLHRFNTASYAANAKQYLQKVITEIASRCSKIKNAWKTTGDNYLKTFSENTSSSVGGSLGMLVNQFCFDIEILKNAAIGIPAGKKSLGLMYPEKCEAYYSAHSLTLAKLHLKQLEQIYTGGNGTGFDDYLHHLQSKYGQEMLYDVIAKKFTSARDKLNAVPETLAQSVNTHTTEVDAVYNELQQLVVLLKVDMTSALGVQITYQDNDGD